MEMNSGRGGARKGGREVESERAREAVREVERAGGWEREVLVVRRHAF